MQRSQLLNLPLQQINLAPTRTSSSSSSHTKGLHKEFAPPSSRTCSHLQAQNATGQLIFPQVTSDPLPIFEGGEGLENENNRQEEISINFVNGDNGWTLVQKKKCKKITNDLKGKWNKRQKKNFVHFGDPYYQEPCKYYHEVDISTPVANLLLQQPVANLSLRQPPIANVPLQQPLANVPLLQPAANWPLQQPPPLQPAVLPAPLPAAPQLPPPLIVITPSPLKCTPEICKRILQAIPEEDKPVDPRQQRIEDTQLPLPLALSPAMLQQLAAKLEQPAREGLQPEVDEGLRDTLECLAISPDQGGQPGLLPILAGTSGKGTSPKLGTSQLVSPNLVSTG
jgi:hypothetical protein